MIAGHKLPAVFLVGQAVDGEILLHAVLAVDEDEVVLALIGVASSR